MLGNHEKEFGAIERRIAVLENSFMKHMDKEEELAAGTAKLLQEIKEEITKTNSTLEVKAVKQELDLTKQKNALLEIVHTHYVSKTDYDKKVISLEKLGTELQEEKLDAQQFKTYTGLFVVFLIFDGWVITNWEHMPWN